MNKNVLMKWGFVFFISMFYFNMNAQVVCTDIVPDSVVFIAASTPSAEIQVDIDMDNDNNPDFRFTSAQAASTSTLGFVIVQAGQIATGNFVLTNGGNDALALNLNDPINASTTTWHPMSSTNPQMYQLFNGIGSGTWSGAQDKYLGVRFITGANTYYGWIRFTFSSTQNMYTIKDYAYESTPNQGILAGQGCASSFTLPATLCATSITSLEAYPTTNSYTWSSSPSGPLFSAPNASVTNIQFPVAGVFTVQLATDLGTAVNTITINPLPTINVVTSNSMICAGTQTAVLTASGAVNYTWTPGPLTGFSIAVSPSVTSSYIIVGESQDGCLNQISFTQSVTVCTNLNTVEYDFSLNIYPNPTIDFITIHSSALQILALSIYSIDGSLVHYSNHFSNGDKIDVKHLTTGVYLVHVQDNYGVIRAKKIMIN